MAIAETAKFVRAEAAEALDVCSYPVNLRITIPFPKPFFITLVVGPERRGAARLRAERARHPFNTWGNLAVVVAASTVLMIATLFAALVAAAI